VFDEDIPISFLQYAADILADTNKGLSGAHIIKFMTPYAVEHDVRMSYPTTSSFGGANKRTVLLENLSSFSAPVQYQILMDLCGRGTVVQSAIFQKLKGQIAAKFPKFSKGAAAAKINQTLIEETSLWLSDYPNSLKQYNYALTKYEGDMSWPQKTRQ
jgi:hypothetical protein